MMKLIVSLLLAAAAPIAFAAPTPANTVLTPVGMRSAAGLHAVPAGGKISIVGDEVRLLDAHGNIVHSGNRDAGTPVRTPTTASTGVKPEQSGWIAYGDWYNTGDPINYFTTDWTVPDVPATNNGQTVFLFNAIEPASGDAILQPVLQYGGSAAGGGAYWAVASWFLYPSGTYYTNLVQVSTGQDLTGVMTMNGQSGSTYNYTSEFSNVDGTAMQVDGAELLVWATETLEAYGITASSDYPDGSTQFENIYIQTTSGYPSMSWATQSDSNDGVSATVAQDGSQNAVIVINY